MLEVGRSRAGDMQTCGLRDKDSSAHQSKEVFQGDKYEFDESPIDATIGFHGTVWDLKYFVSDCHCQQYTLKA